MLSEMTSMPILRALQFIEMMNDRGVRPSTSHVDAFAVTPLPSDIFAQTYNTLRLGFMDKTVTTYMAQVGFILLNSNGISITALGRAFLAGMVENEDSSELGDGEGVPIEVVGRLSDPVTYARLLTQIDAREHALVVDPYLPAPELQSLLQLSNVERVLSRETRLTGPRPQNAAERTQHLRIALGVNPEVELRFLPSGRPGLHDRLILPSVGSGLIVGTSLGASHFTVVTALGDDTTAQLRAHYNSLWEEAERLEPITRPTETPETNGAAASEGAEQLPTSESPS